jgi:hypothetical protein
VPSSEEDIAEVARLGLKQPRPNLVTPMGELLVMRPYQQLAHHMGVKRRRMIVSLDKGLGKTLVDYLIMEDLGVEKVIVLCTSNAYGTWAKQAKWWTETYGDKVSVVTGQPAQRAKAWRKQGAKVFVMHPTGLLSAMGKLGAGKPASAPEWVTKGSWGLICDEFQWFLRNRTSKIFQLLQKLKFDPFLPTSGSAVSKGPQDIWPVLNLIEPKLFGSYWKYVYAFCEVEDFGVGRRIGGPRPENLKTWRQIVAPYLFHRTKAHVGDQLPPKNRDFLDVYMEPWQEKLHNELRDQLLSIAPDGEYIMASNKLAAIHKMRVALICPKALNPEYGYGAGIEAIVETCKINNITRYVINTPFRAPIPYLQAFLKTQGLESWVFQGGISTEDRDSAIGQWTERGGAIIQTIKYAQSYELLASSYGFFLGYEWDPEQNKQAEDRQHRLVTKDPVFMSYVRHVGAYDENIIDILMNKATDVRTLFSSWDRVRAVVTGEFDLSAIPDEPVTDLEFEE